MSRQLRSLKFTSDTYCWHSMLTSNFKALTIAFLLVFLTTGTSFAQCLPVASIDAPADLTVECGTNLEDLEITGTPTVDFNDCGSIEIEHSDAVISNDGCVVVYSRTWMVYSGGDLLDSDVQVITVEDTTGPVISGVQPVIELECNTLPEPDLVTVVDECGSSGPLEVFTSQTGEPISTCCLTTAYGPGSDWSIWLPLLSNGSCCFNSANWIFADCGHFDQYADGTARIHGTVYNSADPAQQLIVDIWLTLKRDWAAWSALGRGYRDDMGVAAGGQYMDWSYYELVNGFSTLTGAGSLTGDILYLSHAPASKYFGFQAGERANNRNLNNGLSGSFSYTGTIGGNEVCCQNGDLNVDVSGCEETGESDCVHSTSFTRFYRAFDNCGNATVVAQEIIINDTTSPEFVNCPSSITIQCDEEVPAIAQDLEATDNCTESADIIITFLGEEEVVESNCYRTLTRTWAATDLCGNVAVCEQLITIVDTTAPVLNGLPEAELTVECTDVPEAPVVTATDNCTAEVSVNYNESIVEGDCPSNYTIIRTWDAIDACQNAVAFTQTINVVDSTAPVFDEYDIYISADCNEEVGDLTATDNCGDVEVTLIYECYLAGGCLGLEYRIYQAVDECGNVSTAELFIAIQDHEAPEFQNVPEDTEIECSEVSVGEDGNYFDDGGVYAIDNCGYHFYLECLLPIDYTYEEEVVLTDDDCPQSFDIIRTWTATDYCGNVAIATQTVHVVDTTAPWLSIPADYTASCEDELAFEDASAEDNCGEATISVSQEIIPGECPSSYTITRTFVAVDECGNASEPQVQTITVVDETAPVFAEGTTEFTYECDEVIDLNQPLATDNCSEVIEYAYSDTAQWAYGCMSGFTRIWTATDECGNVAYLYQSYTIEDTTAPVISGAFEIERPCDDADGIYVTATDNCNEYSIEIVSSESVSGSCAGNIVRTYVATDICGNVSEEFTQIIHLIDEVAPVITYEAEDFTVECGSEYTVEQPMFEDNCDEELTISYEAVPSTDGCTTTIAYSWTATDNCNNSVTATTVVTIVDTTNPYFVNFPANVTVSCEDEMPEVVYPEAYDNCDESVEILVAEVIVPGDCPNSYWLYRTFRGIDDCGNQVVETQIITVVDETAPVFAEGQTQFTYECDEVIDLNQPLATDNCSEVIEYAYSDTAQWSYACMSGFTRIWTATDECGNVAYLYQSYTIEDTTAPVISGAFEIERPCDDADGIYVTATDNCNEYSIEIVSSELVSGSCAGNIVRTYVATDACGNVSEEFTQIIHLIDEVAPVVETVTENFTIECGIEYIIAPPTFSDNCDEELEIVPSSSTEVDGCTVIHTYTWVASDNCNNSVTATTVVTVVDTTAPILTIPADYTASCEDELVYEDGSAWDLCHEASVSVVVETIEGDCPNSYTITRTFVAVDECGNASEAQVQTITVIDETAPVIGEGQTQFTYECDEVIELNQPIATDNCSELIEYSYSDTAQWAYGCESGFTRIWVVTDECGNSAYAYHYYTIVDTTAPVISGALEIERPCDDADGIYVTATDNCNEYSIEIVSSELVSGSCAGNIVRTYIATDVCGNVSEEFTQIIHLIDEVAPVIETETEDFTVECGQEFSVTPPTFSDNCDEELTITAASSVAIDGCVETQVYTWTATDNCNNSVTSTTVVTIVDTTAPILTIPADYTASCEDELVYEDGSAWDLCHEASVSVVVETIEGDCPNSYTITRTFVAVDECGNASTTQVQTITVIDETAPVFEESQNSFVYECEEVIPANQPVATDNCSETIAYSYVDTLAWEYGCNQGFTRIWTATDECGNSSDFYQSYEVVDTTAPVITGAVDIERPCDDYEGIYITATDNCNEVTITVIDEEHVSGSCAGVVIRIYRAADECGNFTDFTQIIHLTDEVAPVIESETEDFTVECGDDYVVTPPVFSDNCDTDLIITSSQSSETDGCTTWVTYTWTAVDHCGNETTSSTVVTIVDTTAPIINSQSFETTLPCHIPGAFETPTATDNCDEDVEVLSSYQSLPGECPGEYTEIFTYTAVDNCGNSSSVTYTVHHIDNEAPVLENIPSSNEYSCDEEVPVELPTAVDACSNAIVTYSDSIIAGQCANSYVIVRTFIATDECGNVSEPAYVSYYIYDVDAPEFVTNPANESYECLDWDNYTAQSLVAVDNCGEVTVSHVIISLSGDDCGNGVWQVLYTATDACWNSDTISYLITVDDVTAPVLSEYPSNLVIDCGTELPEAPELWATDNCDEFVEVSMTSTCLSGDCPEVGATPACVLKTPVRPASNPCVYPFDWAMALFGMPNDHKWYQLVPGTATMTNNGDGTLSLYGELVNAMHVALPADQQGGFIFNVTFENESDWAAWSSQAFPTGFKGDCGGVGANHEDWIYYLLSNTEGYELLGTGIYAGSHINLTHAPANNYFGFQMGEGANNYNAANGFGGWFNYSGDFQGGIVSGAGDFAFEIDCCVEYDLQRCWTAIDCSGNEVSWCQVISYRDLSTDLAGDDSNAMVIDPTVQQIAILSMAPNPTSNISHITFTSTESERLSLQVLDMTGRVVADLYNGDVVGGVVNKVDFNANALQGGIYMMRLNSTSETDVQRIQIVR